MPHIIKNHPWSILFLCMLLLLTFFVAACGGASSNSGTAAESIPASSNVHSSAANQQKSASSSGGPGGSQQYLVKTLNISMEVKYTQRVANDLQAWISATDPLSTAENINYEQVGDNLYNVTMTFSVQASLYPRIENYLNTYPIQHHGRLLSANKTTQDVSGDYVDTQSRLKNLRAEQDRLLTLLSHATALGDILSIDQRLTDIEGQIEQIEAHLNQLNGQTSFYNITVSLQPSQAVVNPPPAAWSIAQVWQSALSAAIAFAVVLVTVLIWLAVFSVYLIPVALVVWFVRRWRHIRVQRFTPDAASPTFPPSVP